MFGLFSKKRKNEIPEGKATSTPQPPTLQTDRELDPRIIARAQTALAQKTARAQVKAATRNVSDPELADTIRRMMSEQ